MRVLIVLVLLPLQILSQDLTGIRTGLLQTRGTDLPYEIVIMVFHPHSLFTTCHFTLPIPLICGLE